MKAEKGSNKGLLYAGITAFLWGFLAIAIKVSLNSLNPVSVVWFRFTIAFLLLFIILLIFDRTSVFHFKFPPISLFLAAIFLGLNYLGFISGLHQTTPSNGQVFIQVGPVSFAIIGIIYFREKISLKHITGFILLIAGLGLFYSEQIIELAGSAGNYSRGISYIVLGGLSWACFSTLQKILVRKWNPNNLNLFIYGFCSLLFLPFVEFHKIPLMELKELLLLIFLGMNTLVAYGSLALALKYAEANKVSVIITINPLITFIMMAILDLAAVTWIQPEKFTILSIVGALLVMSGAVMVIISGSGKYKTGIKAINS